MSKFKVGDKVRVTKASKLFGMSRLIGKVGIISRDDGSGIRQYRLDIDDPTNPWSESELELVEPRREFIVIRRDGAKTISELWHDREVIKSAKATCAPSDTFDFNTGAKLAFDRLMGRANIKEAMKAWNKPSHAPEPPKFYTGSVRCTGCTPIATFAYEGWIGKIITFKDGYSNFYGKDNNKYRFTSFEDFCKKNNQGTFAEVKPDVL